MTLNQDLLREMDAELKAEEEEDAALRAQHGANFNRAPSASVNAQYKQQVADFTAKLNQAVTTDENLKTKYAQSEAGFKLLAKTRQDLCDLIPKTAGSQDMAQNPAVMAIQRALSDIDDITTAKEKCMAEGVAMNDNLNAVEELMKVHTKQMEKQAVFD